MEATTPTPAKSPTPVDGPVHSEAGITPTARSRQIARRSQFLGLLAFLKHPTLPERPLGATGASIWATLRLLMIDIAFMTILIMIALAITAGGVEIPENALDNMALTIPLILLIIVLAPIFEEMVFRSWLSGRPGFVVPAVILMIGVVVSALLVTTYPIIGIPVGLAGVALSLWAAARLKDREPWPFFTRHFRWFFYGTCLAFAAVHLTNFDGANAGFAPLVIPQLVSGTIFGFARVHYGLWSAIFLHMAHNSVFIAAALSEAAFG
ncbi:MAG: CPBP family glutamic-type intramembrane protease [Pontixanthobacter sp.]